jgi:chemotaxis response regulator CheB
LLIVAVAHGGCYDVGNFSSRYAYEIASYGFLVVAKGKISTELEEATQKLAAATRQAAVQSKAVPPVDLGAALPQGLLKRSKTSQLFEAMDWAKMQNGKTGSPYLGKLDSAAIAVIGASCGGLQALDAALDPRAKTAVIVNSGIMRTGIPEGEAGAPIRKMMADLR